MFTVKDRLPQDAVVSSRPVTIATPARISTNPRQESQTRPFIFNRLRTLLRAQKLQIPHFHSLPHSLQQEQSVTRAFPITPALFVPSWASVGVSTPLLSCACALFVKTTREGVGGRTPKIPCLCAHLRVPSRHSTTSSSMVYSEMVYRYRTAAPGETNEPS